MAGRNRSKRTKVRGKQPKAQFAPGIGFGRAGETQTDTLTDVFGWMWLVPHGGFQTLPASDRSERNLSRPSLP